MANTPCLGEAWPEPPDTSWEEVLRLGGSDLLPNLGQSSFALLGIPSEFGGFGASLSQLASAQRLLATYSGSAAIAANMHTFSLALLVEHWRQRRDHSWMLLEGLASSPTLVGNAFAEPGIGANFMNARLVAEPSSSGYRLTGRKFPCSLVSTAGFFTVSARDKVSGSTIVALCPARSPGLSRGRSWDSIGMRSSDTGELIFDCVEVDRRLVFHQNAAGMLDELMTAGLVWFSVLLTATYHGILTTLVGEMADAVSALDNEHVSGRSRRHSALGESVVSLAGLGSTCLHVAALQADGGARTALAEALALRVVASRTVDAVLAEARRLLGSRMYSAADRVSQLQLDLLAVEHHPPNAETCRRMLAEWVLGQPFDLQERNGSAR